MPGMGLAGQWAMLEQGAKRQNVAVGAGLLCRIWYDQAGCQWDVRSPGKER